MKRPEKSAAILTIKDAPKMTASGRRAVAQWLRKQAKFLEKDGSGFAKRFTARYLYLLLLVSIICSASPARAETYSLGLCGSLYLTTSPRTAGCASFYAGDDKTRSFSTIELRPVNGQPTHSVRSGVERTLFSGKFLDLLASGQIGLALSPSALSGDMLGAVGVAWKPSFLHGIHVVIRGSGSKAPALIQGWEPVGQLEFRYQFRQ